MQRDTFIVGLVARVLEEKGIVSSGERERLEKKVEELSGARLDESLLDELLMEIEAE